MGSPITLSGFNNIDFNAVLSAIMQQERLPVAQLETQKKTLESQKTLFSTLASRMGTLRSAVSDLTGPDAFNGTQTTISDPTRLAVASGSTAPPGTYEVTVLALARAQVTVSASGYVDRDTAIVAGPGTLSIGGVDVTLDEGVTLEQLAAAINRTEGIGVTASVVRNSAGYQVMLTGRDTGVDGTFAVDSGTSGFSFAATNAQEATDARILLNGVEATSASNVFDGVVSGTSFTVLKADPENPVTLTITASLDSIKTLIQRLVTAFNDANKFINEQQAAANRGETNNLGRDALLRGLRRTLVNDLTTAYPGGRFESLAEVGFELTRTGELTFDATRFEAAVASGRVDVEQLFRGADGRGGAFGTLVGTIDQYTSAGGLVPNATQRIDSQVQALSKRISAMEDRLAIRREALQREFIAADQAIAALNQQQSSLGSLGSAYRLF
jgi:flagellar hook-associated protein 2